MIELIFVIGVFFVGCGMLFVIICDLLCLMLVMVGVWCWGVVVLDLVYVVCGCFDGYWECGIYLWDVVVGILLVKEVGGFVELICFEESVIEFGNIVVFNV